MNKCHICCKEFSTKSNLTRHMGMHTGERPFKCDSCEKTFSQQREKLFICNFCERSFSHNSDLTKHKRIHTGEKPYSCDTCEKAFRTSSELTVHKRTLTGEKPYSCEFCQKSYSSSSELSKHNKSSKHLKKFESTKNTVSPSASTSFVDCGEADSKGDLSSNKQTIKERSHTLAIHVEKLLVRIMI